MAITVAEGNPGNEMAKDAMGRVVRKGDRILQERSAGFRSLTEPMETG
jgi:hypothetical protein